MVALVVALTALGVPLLLLLLLLRRRAKRRGEERERKAAGASTWPSEQPRFPPAFLHRLHVSCAACPCGPCLTSSMCVILCVPEVCPSACATQAACGIGTLTSSLLSAHACSVYPMSIMGRQRCPCQCRLWCVHCLLHDVLPVRGWIELVAPTPLLKKSTALTQVIHPSLSHLMLLPVPPCLFSPLPPSSRGSLLRPAVQLVADVSSNQWVERRPHSGVWRIC